MKKKVIFSLLAICLVAGMVGIGTWAYFSDIETSPANVFEAGTLDLVVDDANPLTSTMFDVSNVQPGYEGVLEVVAQNIGTCPGTAFIHLRQTCNEDNGIWEPEDMVDGVLDNADGTANGDLPNNMYVTIEADGSVIAGGDGKFKDIRSNKLMLGDLDAGASMTILISWEIPGYVGNIIQSDRLCFDIDFILDQKVGEAAFEIGNLVQDAVAIECDDTTVSVDVTNTGTATGVVTVSCDIDGIHMEKTVAVEAGATVTVDFTVHLAAGSYLVDVSIPGMALEPCPVEVVAPGAVGLGWEEAPLDTIYVCDDIMWLVVAHNGGGVSITADVTLTVTVGGTEKYTETQAGVVFDPCDYVILTFGPWHAEDDPFEYSGTVVVDVDGTPGLSHSFTLVDEPPTVVNILPVPMAQFEAGASVAIEASADDDVGVIMVLYCIDPIDEADFAARAQPLIYDPVSETYKGDWDTTGWPLGPHAVVVVALDTLMQPSVECVTPVVLYGAEWTFTDLDIPDTGLTCEDIPVSVHIHNSGTITGSYSVTVEADGWSHTFSGSLDPCDEIDLETTLHFTDPGTYTVTFGPAGVELIEISAPGPPTWSVGDSWTYDAKFYLPYPDLCEDDTEVVTVASLDPAGSVVGDAGYVLPEDCYGTTTAFTEDPGSPPCQNPGDVDRFSVIGWVVIDPATPPLSWNSQQTLDEVYREAWVGALFIVFNWEYLEEALPGYVPTADHGWPYDVGKEWALHSSGVVYIGGPPPAPILTSIHTYAIVEVTAEVVITVPAGTFTVKHIVQWEVEVDTVGDPVLDGDGHWIKVTPPAAGNETWFEDDAIEDVRMRVKFIDRGTYEGPQYDELENWAVAP